MARLFVGNFDFEHRLANSVFQPSKSLVRLCAERASAWLAIADDGDYLWSPLPFVAQFTSELARLGLPRVNPVTDIRQAPEDSRLVPWGWTAELVELSQRRHGSFPAPDGAVVRRVNSRGFSWRLESEWCVGLPGSSLLCGILELPKALHAARKESDRVVIKAEFGMSGRERIILAGEPTKAQLAWVEKRLAETGTVIVEPWLNCIDEVGIQIEIPQTGPSEIVGLTSLVSDDRGQYCGSWFTDPPDAGPDFSRRWQPSVEIALQAAERIQREGYFGPLGIDAMRYRTADGSRQVRPLMDINARWTMGRLSLGWRRMLRAGERGFWSHEPDPKSDPSQFEILREIGIPSTVSSQAASKLSFVAGSASIRDD